MPRTDSSSVQGILLENYDGSSSLSPFIAAAGALTDKVSSNDSDGILDATDLELIERWLSAHFYAAGPDMLPQSKGTGRANASFQGQTGMFLKSTYYGQMAMLLDTTGYLGVLQQDAERGRGVASASWLGTRYKYDESEEAGDQ